MMIRPSRGEGGPIPVTVIGGFLGTGKTTLVNHVLSGEHGLKLVVLVNDFGNVNIDAALIDSAEAGIYSLKNGCICCSINQGLVERLEELLAAQAGRIDAILIESSGLSDPSRIADTVRYARFRGRLRLDAVVVLVDPEHFERARRAAPGIAEAQLDAADIVVLNKCDLIARPVLDAWKRQWAFPGARVVEATRARVPMSALFEAPSSAEASGRPAFDRPPQAPPSLDAESWTWRASGRLDPVRLKEVLINLPPAIFRAKGVVRPEGESGQPLVVHVVGTRLTIEKSSRPPSSLSDPHVLVFIALGGNADFPALERRLGACLMDNEPPPPA